MLEHRCFQGANCSRETNSTTMSEEAFVAKLSTTRIPEHELLVFQEALKEDIFHQIRRLFNVLGITQKELAERLGIDEGALSRRLRGDHDMRIDTLSDLARGLGCRIRALLQPLAELRDVLGENTLHFFDSRRGFKREEKRVTTDTVLVKIITPPSVERPKP